MAFITKRDGTVLSFAEYADVVAKDSRVFEANEGLTQEMIEDFLIRSSDRLIQKLKASAWWRIYNNVAISGSMGVGAVIPDPNKAKLKRQSDWTDLCVMHTLKEYVYPKIADFGTENAAEVQKIAFYDTRFDAMWEELLAAGDFYDTDGDGSVEDTEKMLKPRVTRRTRGYRSIAGVR